MYIPTVHHVPIPPSADAQKLSAVLIQQVEDYVASHPNAGPADVQVALQLARQALHPPQPRALRIVLLGAVAFTALILAALLVNLS